MQAVVKIQGSQYLVSPGDELLVNNLDSTETKLSFDQVLLYSNESKFFVGKPLVEKCVVNAENLGPVKGDKLRVAKYKAKSRYRRVIGFRSKLNRIRITDIVLK